ncbi:MAG: outer membrane protein assembly factor BamD [Prevotella sp.]|nr:outer membrane protein assembly factor BamD [Prevotella sp.]
MKIKSFIVVLFVLLVTGCAQEFNQVFKSTDAAYKYEYAKEAFAQGKYVRASSILETVITTMKGTDNAQESLYLLAMSQFLDKDYEGAAATFKRYYQSYPRGVYGEEANFYIGESLFKSTPEPRLDQSPTMQAIASFQEFLDLYPDSDKRPLAQQRLFELQNKLVLKELYSAQLYYNLGQYFGNCAQGGNNYEACIITAQNAIKDYPYTTYREDFSVLIMKSKFELAQQSVEAKKLERYQDAEDECYGFLNEFPESKEVATAEKYIEKCKEVVKD